jgi:phosphatidylinositol alpha-1,6-mannosyltransferase
VLITTPDFPPATGGIQRLLGRLVQYATSWETLVVALADPDGAQEPELGMTRRVPRVPMSRRAEIARLNAVTVREGRAWHPDAVLAGHIVASPGAVLLGRSLGIPTLQYLHAKELTYHPELARFAVTRSTKTVAVSNHTARLAVASGASPANVRVITPGVDAPNGDAGAPIAKASVPTILTVARLTNRYKGFDVMLRALPLVRGAIPDARWVVVGDGPLRPELERTAAAWGLGDAVLFCGTVPTSERDDWLRRAHVFAMPSRLPPDGGGEGYGLVYLEAGSHGLPCVAGDAGAVAEAIIQLLSDPARASKLGQAGREHASALTWGRMASAVETLVLDAVVASR